MNMESLKDNLINLIYHNSPNVIFIIDSNGIIVHGNNTIENYYGYTSKELMGKHISGILSIHQESLFKEKFAKLQNLETIDTEIKITRKNGTIKNIWRKAIPLSDDNNAFIGSIVFDRDISTQKQAGQILQQRKKLFESMINSNLEATIAINSKGKVIIFNPAAEKMFLFKKGDIIGNTLESIIPNEYIERYNKGVEQYFSSGKPISLAGKVIELPAKKSDGTLFYIEISFCRGKIGSENIVISMVRDISIHKKTKRKLFDAKVKVEESKRLKTSFLANMTHEIRTPLNHIVGFSELLHFADSKDERTSFIEQINKSSKYLLDILNDIIHISELESQIIELEVTGFSLNEMLTEIHTTFSREKKCSDNKIMLSFKKPKKQEHDTIYADKSKLLLILTNLLQNAFKYTKEGVIEFGYTLERYGNKQYWQFYIKDTGIGIDAPKRKTIFESFKQADNSKTKNYGGLGLGLTIAKSYVEQHGGAIWFKSSLGIGSVFYFSVPFNSKQNNITGNSNRKTIQGNNWKEKKILVVDDNEANRILIKTMLSQKGAEIITASGGREAIDIFGKLHDIDLVLMDIRMPEMDGYEATCEIRKTNKTIPIIAQTAFSTIKELDKCFVSGCDDFITKPITRTQLFNVVSDYL